MLGLQHSAYQEKHFVQGSYNGHMERKGKCECALATQSSSRRQKKHAVVFLRTLNETIELLVNLIKGCSTIAKRQRKVIKDIKDYRQKQNTKT